MAKYWAETEEDAIATYVRTDNTALKHKLYCDVIERAFRTLIENIFYTYHFNKLLGSLENVEHEMLVYLYERICKFDPDKGKKSFSYFGTVTKNWMIQQSNAVKKKVPIDENENTKQILNISIKGHKEDSKKEEDMEFISLLSSNLMESQKLNLNDDDIAIAEIVTNLLKNYDTFNIYNKKQVYLYIKEGTGLPSRKVTKTLKKLKLVYNDMKKDFYE